MLNSSFFEQMAGRPLSKDKPLFLTLLVLCAIIWSMIKSFSDKDTERLFRGQRPRKLPNSIWKRGTRKLLIIHAANDLSELRIPPGNRLEKLKGDREGEHSIRINDQWRICFLWRDGHAYQVEITDYHS